jgi:hypothetical protein
MTVRTSPDGCGGRGLPASEDDTRSARCSPLNLETDVQFVIIGGLLIGAVIIDSVARRARAGRDR